MVELTDLPIELIQHIARYLRRPRDVNALLRTCQATRQAMGTWPYHRHPLCIRGATIYAVEHGNLDIFNLTMELEETPPMDRGLLGYVRIAGKPAMLKRLFERPDMEKIKQQYAPAGDFFETSLPLVAEEGNFEMLEYMFKMCDEDPALAYGALHSALERRDNSPIIRMLIDAGPNLSQKDDRCGSLVDTAVRHGNLEGLRMLLEAGAPATEGERTSSGKPTSSPLKYMRWHDPNAMAMTELLMQYGAPVSGAWTKDRRPMLHTVLTSGNPRREDIASLLLRRGAGISSAGSDTMSGIETVFSFCSVDMCKVFVDQGLLACRNRQMDKSIWEVVARSGNAEKLAWVLQDPRFQEMIPQRMRAMETPTELLQHARSPAVIRMLVKHGADPDDAPGLIMSIAKEEQIEECLKGQLLKTLFENGAKLNWTEGETRDFLIDELGRYRRDVTIPVLIDGGMHVDDATKNELLSYCVNGCNRGRFAMKVLKPLVDWGADINFVNDDGQTILHAVLKQHHYRSLDLLLSLGADPTVVDNGGNTLLHGIFKDKSGLEMKTVTTLLDLGLDPHQANNDGFTPLDLALRSGSPRVIKLYLDRGVDPHSLRMMRSRGAQAMISTVHLAAAIDKRHGLQTLTRLGVDVNRRDARGRTPLHWARAQGNLDRKELLRRAGADRLALDDEGRAAQSVVSQYEDFKQPFFLTTFTDCYCC